MTEASLQQIGLHGTRLVRYLSDLAVLDRELSHVNFSERLGRLIDFGDSMRLAALHDKLHGMSFEPGPGSAVTAREEVLRVRMALMQSVVRSFAPAPDAARIKLPTLEAGVPLDKLASFEPYHHFYAAHQREFASRIQSLQFKVGNALCAISAELAQLAALDEALRDSLSVHARKNLAVIPQLLARRFDFLRQDMQGTAGTGDQSAEDLSLIHI